MAALQNVNVEEALALVAAGALLLDVREDAEWGAGHAPDALHVSLSEVPDRLEQLPRNRVVVCVCRSGARSARAANYLLEHGFEAVNLEGGMISWHTDGAAIVADGVDPSII